MHDLIKSFNLPLLFDKYLNNNNIIPENLGVERFDFVIFVKMNLI